MSTQLKRLDALASELRVTVCDLRVKRVDSERFIATAILNGPNIRKRFSVRQDTAANALETLYGMCCAHLLAERARLALPPSED